jgi:hypothetical protein
MTDFDAFHDSAELAALMDSLAGPDDRRGEPRFDCSYTVEFENQPAKGVVTDISRNGMRIRLAPDNYITDVKDLKCWIWIHGGILKLSGQIVRVGRKREISIKFLNPVRSLGHSRLCSYVGGFGDVMVDLPQAKLRATGANRPERALTRGLRLDEGGFLVVKEHGVPELSDRLAGQRAREAAQQAEAESKAKAEATERETAEKASLEAARQVSGSSGISTMRRSRGAGILSFWIDRRGSSHYAG